MKALRLLLPLLAVFLCNCPLPTDPMQDYSSCDVVFAGGKSSVSYPVNDTVTITIALELPHLLDKIELSIGDEDTTIVCNYSKELQDTIILKKVYSTPDTIALVLTAFKKDNTLDSASLKIIITGNEPAITGHPSNLYSLEPGHACTLSVAVEGSKPLHFQWFKDDEKLKNDTLDTLIIPYFQAGDTGEYYCTVSNGWGSASSKSATLILKTVSDKNVFWKFGIYPDSLYEGETLNVAIDNHYSVPSDEDPVLSFISPVEQAALSGDSLFSFIAGRHDSGFYSLPVLLKTGSGADTAIISVKVLPRYCTLTLKADSGSIEADPEKEAYRWGDTVSLTAVPDEKFRFVEWSGDASGNSEELEVPMIDDREITALFTRKATSGCVELHSGSLNKAIRDASPSSARPGSVCPEEGLYENGTTKVWGTVRFIFQ